MTLLNFLHGLLKRKDKEGPIAPNSVASISTDTQIGERASRSVQAAADLKTQSLAEGWKAAVEAWKNPKVKDFIARAQTDPALLLHANECWDVS